MSLKGHNLWISKKKYIKKEKNTRENSIKSIPSMIGVMYVYLYDVIVHSCKGLKSSEYQLKISLG